MFALETRLPTPIGLFSKPFPTSDNVSYVRLGLWEFRSQTHFVFYSTLLPFCGIRIDCAVLPVLKFQPVFNQFPCGIQSFLRVDVEAWIGLAVVGGRATEWRSDRKSKLAFNFLRVWR